MKRILPFIVLLAVLAGGYYLYSTSVDEDFKDISRVEVNRIGETYTGVYHRPACPKVESIKSGVKEFENTKEAEAAGYSPCKRCKPNED